jgi:hypothetical protein
MGFHGTYTSKEGPRNALFLDRFNQIGAAFSLRRLRNSYLGPCIKVRRDSDNAEMDIRFVKDKLDTQTLLSFCRSASGFVTTWYDQSVLGLNATQATTSSQPRIVNVGVLETNAGYPCIQFNSHFLQIVYTGIASLTYLLSCNVIAPNIAAADDVNSFQCWSYDGGGANSTAGNRGLQWGAGGSTIALERMAMFFSNATNNGGRLGATSTYYSHVANELFLLTTVNATTGSVRYKNYATSTNWDLTSVITAGTDTSPSNCGTASTNIWIKSTNGAANAIAVKYYELVFAHGTPRDIKFRQMQKEILSYYNVYTSHLFNGAS